MRVLHVLFAIYLLALSVYPCSDSDTCADERKSGVVAVNMDDHDHSSDEMDLCSPFCICSCCSTHIQLNRLAETTPTNLIHNTQVTTLYFERPLLDNVKAIWQPPRIA